MDVSDLDVEHLLAIKILGNELESWAIATGVTLIAWMVLALLRRVGVSRLRALAGKTTTRADDAAIEVLAQTKWWLLFVAGLYLGSIYLDLAADVRQVAYAVMALALIAQGGIWASAIITAVLERTRERRMEEDPGSVTTLNAIGFLSKLALWSVVVLLALDNLGFNITALVAGLGVGGVAVALAVQNILGDLFASLSIVFDKPFAVGDFIIVDDLLGSVEYVGLKTTRVRSLSGEQLIFANSDMLSSRIRNFGRMYKRRVVFHIGVTYQTPREKLIKIPEILREAIEAQAQAKFDRSHFQKYGDFSLDFETVYYVLVPDYNVYMDIQQAVNLYIHEKFEAEGIEFAYPTQTIFMAASAPA